MEGNALSGKKNVGKSIHAVKLSKSLSWLLRHGAEREGLTLDEGGYLDIEKILAMKQFKKYSVEDIVEVVNNNDKKRFALRHHTLSGKLQIRANQGHSLCVSEEGLLTPLTFDTIPDIVVHGTYISKLNNIRSMGLHRMKRNHVHFAPDLPGEAGVVSGMRKNCEVYIVLDAKKAALEGLKFYSSENNVILCPGDSKGYIAPKYFKQIWQISPLKRIC